ncbi:unnamed protein product [Leuciscus chuanchicus]
MNAILVDVMQTGKSYNFNTDESMRHAGARVSCRDLLQPAANQRLASRHVLSQCTRTLTHNLRGHSGERWKKANNARDAAKKTSINGRISRTDRSFEKKKRVLTQAAACGVRLMTSTRST